MLTKEFNFLTKQISEAEFWQQIKRNIPKEVHASRIENTSGAGISDVSAARKGSQEVWLELKVNHGSNVHFRNSQRSWITARTAAGGRVLAVVKIGDSVGVYSAASVLECPYTHIKDRKAFYVKVQDMPEPIFLSVGRTDWSSFWSAVFGG